LLGGALFAPTIAIGLSAIAWVTSLSRSSFWADDFLNVTHFFHTFGSLSDDQTNKGKYVINLFWAIGTYAFGQGSDVPFLLLNSMILLAGLTLYLRAREGSGWTATSAWWVAGVWAASATWTPIALWSSNVTHSCGFLSLGLGLWAHGRCMRATEPRSALAWALASGAAWTLAVISDLIYLGLLALAAHCVHQQVLKAKALGVSWRRALAGLTAWSLGLPLVYFAAVAYPATTNNQVYGANGLSYIHANLRYYRAVLAPGAVLAVVYAAIILLALWSAISGLRRRQWLPAALVIAAAGTAFPALIQAQQRGVQYLAMSLLLTLTAAVMPIERLLRSGRLANQARTATFAVGAVILALIFDQGADLRNYFEATPMGSSLASFRSSVATLARGNGQLCVTMDLNPEQQLLFNAAMEGASGFSIPPIDAPITYLLPTGGACPSPAATHVLVSLNIRGEYLARAG
jgi:hypothetical protein